MNVLPSVSKAPLGRLALSLLLLATPLLAAAQDAAPAPAHFGLVSLLPPLLAISMALIFKQVILALFLGIWVGAWALHGFSLSGLGQGMMDTAQIYVVKALADEGNASVIVFTLLIGGLVGIISRNGGMLGVVRQVARWASDARRACFATAGLGLAIFFDDYANTMVVGNAMRPVTDNMRVSRAKLAYIVDSTAAPVACIALITTWIGYEVGLIGDAAAAIGLEMDAYLIFLNALPYSFYPLLAIAFVFIMIHSGRDFGPMARAEAAAARSREDDEGADADGGVHGEVIHPVEEKPRRAINAIVPILTLLVGVAAGIWVTGAGEGKNLQQIVGDGDSYAALVWASLAACVVAAALSLTQGILTLNQTMNAFMRGMRSMLMALTILVMAWALSSVTEALGTGLYLVEQLGDAINPVLLPTLVFVLAALTAFGTGTSFGTMGILIPLVVPLAYAVVGGGDLTGTSGAVFFASVASVLGGAVWGDHVSPISDTTILSSLASGCDHVEHVNTQMPYAMTVAAVAIALGLIPIGFGVPWWVSLLAGLVILWFVPRTLGRSNDPVPTHEAV
ncbi:MAG: Na+/H+ antiporter NhaC family protein [Pseudomonadota bacterium]